MKDSIKTIRFAIWKSTFPDDAPTIRLHEIAWMKADKDFYIDLPSTKKLQILYTVNGLGRLKYKGKIYMLEPGKAFFVDRQEQMGLISSSDDWGFVWLEISGSMAYSIYHYVTRENGYVYHVKNEMSLMLKSVYEKASQEWTQARDVEMSGLLYEVTTLLFLAQSSQQKFEKALKYIHEHYQETIRLDDLATAVCMSKYHFVHAFHELFGSTPIDYINKYRMEQAQYLLVTTRLPVSVVANKVGIGDQSYFARLFRNYTGYPPFEFRKEFTE